MALQGVPFTADTAVAAKGAHAVCIFVNDQPIVPLSRPCFVRGATFRTPLRGI